MKPLTSCFQPPCYAVIFSNQRTEARDAGRAQWYRDFKVRIAKVEREYGWHTRDGMADPAGAAP
jgi:hypothetical protein